MSFLQSKLSHNNVQWLATTYLQVRTDNNELLPPPPLRVSGDPHYHCLARLNEVQDGHQEDNPGQGQAGPVPGQTQGGPRLPQQSAEDQRQQHGASENTREVFLHFLISNLQVFENI